DWSSDVCSSDLVLILGGVLPAAIIQTRRWSLIRGAAVMYMTTTGVIYAALLGGVFNPFDGSHSWMDAVLHQLIPIVMILDLLLRPPATRLTFRGALVWTVYPLLYVAYTLVRGSIVDWYPYDF